MSRRLVVACLIVSLGGFLTPMHAAQADGMAISPDDDWEDIVAAAARAAHEADYRGEAVSASWETGAPSAHLVEISGHDGVVRFRVGGSGDPVAGPGVGAGSVESAAVAGDVGVVRAPEAARLASKYEVVVASRVRVLDRECVLLEIRERDTRDLRERLWVDVSTALLLRRESYEGGRVLRVAAFLSLEEGPPDPASSVGRRATVPEGGSAVPVHERGVTALRAAGWVVPKRLPGGYVLEEVYAHGGDGTPPLQMVYGDGLYAVSLFEQRGVPEWDSLPPGAQPADGLGMEAYEWPGKSPRRLVWSGGDATFTLVGDATPSEFRRMAEALPHEATGRGSGWVGRVWQTFGRWWDRLVG